MAQYPNEHMVNFAIHYVKEHPQYAGAIAKLADLNPQLLSKLAREWEDSHQYDDADMDSAEITQKMAKGAMLRLLLELEIQAKSQGKQVDPYIKHEIAELGSDPEKLAYVFGVTNNDDKVIKKALSAVGIKFSKAHWDQDKHPRGSNGHFISKARLYSAFHDPVIRAQIRGDIQNIKDDDRRKRELYRFDHMMNVEEDIGFDDHMKDRHLHESTKMGKDDANKFTEDVIGEHADDMTDKGVSQERFKHFAHNLVQCDPEHLKKLLKRIHIHVPDEEGYDGMKRSILAHAKMGKGDVMAALENSKKKASRFVKAVNPDEIKGVDVASAPIHSPAVSEPKFSFLDKTKESYDWHVSKGLSPKTTKPDDSYKPSKISIEDTHAFLDHLEKTLGSSISSSNSSNLTDVSPQTSKPKDDILPGLSSLPKPEPKTAKPETTLPKQQEVAPKPVEPKPQVEPSVPGTKVDPEPKPKKLPRLKKEKKESGKIESDFEQLLSQAHSEYASKRTDEGEENIDRWIQEALRGEHGPEISKHISGAADRAYEQYKESDEEPSPFEIATEALKNMPGVKREPKPKVSRRESSKQSKLADELSLGKNEEGELDKNDLPGNYIDDASEYANKFDTLDNDTASGQYGSLSDYVSGYLSELSDNPIYKLSDEDKANLTSTYDKVKDLPEEDMIAEFQKFASEVKSKGNRRLYNELTTMIDNMPKDAVSGQIADDKGKEADEDTELESTQQDEQPQEDFIEEEDSEAVDEQSTEPVPSQVNPSNPQEHITDRTSFSSDTFKDLPDDEFRQYIGKSIEDSIEKSGVELTSKDKEKLKSLQKKLSPMASGIMIPKKILLTEFIKASRDALVRNNYNLHNVIHTILEHIPGVSPHGVQGESVSYDDRHHVPNELDEDIYYDEPSVIEAPGWKIDGETHRKAIVKKKTQEEPKPSQSELGRDDPLEPGLPKMSGTSDEDFRTGAAAMLVENLRSIPIEQKEARRYFEAALRNLPGVRKIGKNGEVVNFHPGDHEGIEGVKEGDEVEIVDPGWRLQDDLGIKTLGKAKVKKKNS